jgi:hypothetical protein
MKFRRRLIIAATLFGLMWLPCLPGSADSGSPEPAPAHTAPVSSLQKSKTVKLTLLIKDPVGKPVGGARVNVWHDSYAIDTGPPDYQEESHADGRVSIEVLAGKTSEVSVEVHKNELGWKDNIVLSGPAVFRLIELRKISIGTDVRDLIHVKVRVENETGSPIEGARVIFGDLGGSRQIEAEGSTGQNGEVTVDVRAWNYSILAQKDGYELGKAPVILTTSQRGKTISSPVIKLKKKTIVEANTNIEVKVTVRSAADLNGISGAQVILSGQESITSGVYSGTTDSSGEARITLKEYGRFKLEISQEFFESLNSEVRIASSETQKDLPLYLLKEKPKPSTASDLVSVKVLAGDKNNAPIAGASVKVEKISVATDASGLATASNVIGLEATSVAVTATAQGYKRQTRTIPVRRGVNYTNATASATFVLEPGEDPAAADTPIAIVVEVLDSFTDQRLSNTAVQIRFRGTVVGQGTSNETGRAKMTLKESAGFSLEELRSGLKVEASHPNYVPKDSDITADLLMPSSAPRIVTVYMERDWMALTKAITLLEGKVAAWDKDVRETSAASGTVSSRTAQLSLIEKRVSAITGELDGFRGIVTGFTGPGTQLRCSSAAQLMTNIERYEAEAQQKAQEVGEKLDAAMAVAQRCAVPEDGAAIKRYHQDAIRLAAEIGRLDKQAGEDSRKLSILVKELEAVRQTLKEAEDRILRFDIEVRAAEALEKQIRADFNRGTALSKDLDKRRDALTDEISDLKEVHGLDPRFIQRLPANLKKRLDDMAALVASRNNEIFSGPSKESADNALLLLSKVRAEKARADKLLGEFRSALCDIRPMNDSVRAINQALLEASADLGLAADLPKKADDCSKRGTCQPLLADIRGLMEEDELELAETRINEARSKGCDVSKATEELEYFRTVRQTANLLAESLENCRFQQALNMARQIPASIRTRPLIAKAIGAVQRGLQAQQRIAQLSASAKLAVERSGQRSSADSYVEEAKMAAEGFPCLMDEVSQFKDQYKGGRSTAKPQVEDLPEDADAPVAGVPNEPRRKPQREALPEDNDDRPVGRTGNTPKRSDADSTGNRTLGASLPMANPWIKDAHHSACCGGRADFSYGLTSAVRKDSYPPSEGGEFTIEWSFKGVPQGEIRQDEEITITVTGTFTASLPNRDLQPPAAGGVRAAGDIDVKEQTVGYIGRTFKQVGKYVLKVRPNAKSVTIELGADYGLGTFAIYRFGAESK